MIIGGQKVLFQGHPVPETLMLWQRHNQEDVTWEGLANLRRFLPSACLEDKTTSEEGGVVTGEMHVNVVNQDIQRCIRDKRNMTI